MRFLSLYFILFFIFGCSQSNKEIGLSLKLETKINSKNLSEELYKDVKKYENEPRYLLDITSDNCYYEILVNDIPVFSSFNRKSLNTAEEIGFVLHKNENQEISFILYSTDGHLLGSNVMFDLKIDQIINESKNKEVYKYSYSPEKENKQSFSYSAKFNVSVPFSTIDLENAEDLSKMNQESLKKNIVSIVEKCRIFLAEKDMDNIARISYPLLKRQFISEYATKSEIYEITDESLSFYGTEQSLTIKALTGYKLKLYSKGKLAALIMDSNDSFLKSKPAIWGTFKDSEIERKIFFPIYFYLPKGKSEFEVY